MNSDKVECKRPLKAKTEGKMCRGKTARREMKTNNTMCSTTKTPMKSKNYPNSDCAAQDLKQR